MKQLLPADQWDEGTIGQYDDGSVRVTREAMMGDARDRMKLKLHQQGPQPVEISFTQQGRPVWMNPGDVLLATLFEVSGLTFRVEQHGRAHPVDYYWEEVEWIEFASPLPSVI